MSLIEELDKARLQVHTDSYSMSIGEMVNLYKDEELQIHPEFQRLYRWTEAQKSKLIESILLGIPLPSFFIAQRSDGIWEVVDGLQRLSTIFSFMGELKDETGKVLDPLKLTATSYLPSLGGRVWESGEEGQEVIPIEIKRLFKREKLDIKIIKRESEGDTKFELFQRLNTGGTKLSEQEVRNCLLLMINREAFTWVQDIVQETKDFSESLPLTTKQKEESYDYELVLRFIVQRHCSQEVLNRHSDVGPYLDEEQARLFSEEKPILNFEHEKKLFQQTFRLMNLALEDNSFKKFNHIKGRHEGAFSTPVYEAMTTGLSKYLEKNEGFIESDLIDKVKEISERLTVNDVFCNVMATKARPLNRMSQMIVLGEELFNEDTVS